MHWLKVQDYRRLLPLGTNSIGPSNSIGFCEQMHRLPSFLCAFESRTIFVYIVKHPVSTLCMELQPASTTAL